MKKDKKSKFSQEEVEFAKAIYKSVLKKIKKGKHFRDDAKEVVADILDENYVAQVDPDEIPTPKTSVVNKSKEDKEKGVHKLKKFQKSKKKQKKTRCWTGYEPVPGKEPYSEGSCRKKK